METSRVTLFLKILAALTAALVAEYVLCGMFFRLVRHSDFWIVDLVSALAGAAFCYRLFHEFLKDALKEGYPRPAVAAFFLVFCFLAASFLRLSAQLANGLLDFSDPQTRVVYVTDKEISSFDGSFREGPSPMAHLLYFQDWDGSGGTCELLAPTALYYSAVSGTPLEISVRAGFFRMPWVEDFRLRDAPAYDGGQ